MASLGLSLVAVRDRSWRAALAAGLPGRTRPRLQAEPGRRGRLRRGPLRRVVAGRPADQAPSWSGWPGPPRPASLCRCSRTVGWALAAGVRLHTLWYAVYGFRFDASQVLSDATDTAPTLRAGLLVCRGTRRRDAPDHRRLPGAHPRRVGRRRAAHRGGRGHARGRPRRAGVRGSFWRDYLFPLLPGTALCAALLARRASRRGRAMRAVIVAAAASTVLCLVGWAVYNASGLQEYDEHDTGVALHEVRRAGRHPGRLRRPGRRPAGERPPVAVRLPVEPADAHPRPGPRRARRR